MGENLKLVTSMAKVLQQASVVEIFLCVAFVLVAHLLEGCSHMDKSEGGRGAADVFMGSNNESSGVFDKLPTPAPTPAPPAPSKCCDGSQYAKCCLCAAQSGAGFSA